MAIEASTQHGGHQIDPTVPEHVSIINAEKQSADDDDLSEENR